MRKTYTSEQTQQKFTGRKKTNLILNVAFQLAFASMYFWWNELKMSEICFPDWKKHLKGPRRYDQLTLALMASDITISVVCFSSLPFMKTSETQTFAKHFQGLLLKGMFYLTRSLQRNPLQIMVCLWKGMDQNIFSRKNKMLQLCW